MVPRRETCGETSRSRVWVDVAAITRIHQLTLLVGDVVSSRKREKSGGTTLGAAVRGNVKEYAVAAVRNLRCPSRGTADRERAGPRWVPAQTSSERERLIYIV